MARVCLRTETLAVLAVRFGLHRLLHNRPSSLVDRIADLVADIESEPSLDHLLIAIDVWYAPQRARVAKLLADLFEAVVGAVFVDSGFDVAKTLHLIRTQWLHYVIERAMAVGPKIPLDVVLTFHKSKKHRGTVRVDAEFVHVEAMGFVSPSVPLESHIPVPEQCRQAAHLAMCNVP